ncbi:DUF4190 domain-containing protein [Mumia sp. Pv 4-285]|uniref:DUF4190 domain-containing protein n=1 Tax=Mumia qirimensis TaxID=3234852 RepID=UPI00351D8D56
MSYPPPGGPTPPGNEPPSYNPPPGGYGGPPPGGYGGPPPGGDPYGEPPKNSTKATWALVTGILGLCCGPLGVVGIVLGRQAKDEIAASNGRLTGAGLAQAGFIIGIIAVVLWALGLVARLSGAV